ncbi:MAG: 50S ribosomal protein L35 [Candidatus Sumerlaeia bacterium]|jgi:large subunit ribosomal protein L35|nr:50S ribosomal protein L35 [Candidatus Sumerlaeia bacterium]
MPKIKTRSAAAKRLKISASGKVRYRKQGLRHILTKKASKRKRQLGNMGEVAAVDMPRVRKMLVLA